MDLTPIKTPKLVKHALPNFVWNLPTEEKVLYLTFDDGPTPEITNWTLDVLNQHNAKATFFCIGNNIEQHPEIFKRIISENHAVGNHTYNHLKGWKTDTQTYINDTLKAQEVINQKSSSLNNLLFRPPYGKILPKQSKQLQQLGYKIIMWSVLTKDWDHTISKEKCFQNAISNTISGDIIVFHDSIKASKNMQYALPKALNYFSEKGYSFKRIPELSQ